MPSIINSSTSGGLITTGSTDGALALQTGGTTALTISSAQAVSLTSGLAVGGNISSGLKSSTFNTIDQQAIVANTTWSGSNPRLLIAITKSGVGSGGLGIDASNDVTVFDTAGLGRLTTKSTGVAVTGTLSVTTGASVGGATAGAGGLAFPATQVAVADANTLDDYEEGTWTPNLQNITVVGTLTVAGKYTKVGNVVYYSGYGSATVSLTWSGSAFISDFPFTGSNPYGFMALRVAAGNSNAQNSNYAGVQNNPDLANARFFLGSFTAAGAGEQLQFSGFYFT